MFLAHFPRVLADKMRNADAVSIDQPCEYASKFHLQVNEKTI